MYYSMYVAQQSNPDSITEMDVFLISPALNVANWHSYMKNVGCFLKRFLELTFFTALSVTIKQSLQTLTTSDGNSVYQIAWKLFFITCIASKRSLGQ